MDADQLRPIKRSSYVLNSFIAGPSNDIDDLVANGIDNIKKIVSLIPGIDSSVTEANASISTTV
ncbi:unnamed protein product [Schistosoma rodhaini]|uniref:Uncharacterized protein n=1 Tax=Schistosoma rodhaini TaxID=6188 RepID=A0AA85FXV1_9TREM|nr:unnamed protein product [Schistosoma rodhaini]CAH8603312.1 unnamed protein product [Schistosoma rodhaini]